MKTVYAPHLRRTATLLLLTSAMLATSGYRFRCWLGCTNQTSTQNDYVVQRNECRHYAEAKIDFAMKNQPVSEKPQDRKAMLVSLFNQCMAANGWNIENKPTTAAAPAPAAAPAAPVAAAPDNSAFLSRQAECAFARHSAPVSSNAAARARACDIECAQRLRAAPEAPRPAACPAEGTPGLDTGRDIE